MEKVDLAKADKQYYSAGKEPSLVTLGPLAYLAVDGQGTPGEDAFQEAFAALYGVAYTTKFHYKLKLGRDYSVAKLEGLYWFPDGGSSIGGTATDGLRWTVLLRVPEFVEPTEVEAMKADLCAKKESDIYTRVRLDVIAEGLCAQIMHVGPYSEERETIARLLAYAEEQGLKPHGPHHEIYMNDPRRTDPSKLRTILRQPVVKA